MTLHRHALNDVQWARLSSHIPAPKARHGRDDRLFLDAVLWIAKTGSPWRDMPERLGAWAQVYQRFARGVAVVIPPKINRQVQREFDSIKYRSRHLIENLFQRMKVFCRIATRFEKLDTRFLGLVHLDGAMKWLH